MRTIPFITGVIMTLIGAYFFWLYFQILLFGDFISNLYLWILSLVVGILLISLGPGVMIWSYATSLQTSFKQIAKQRQWQVIQIPLECSECGKEISIRSMEWIGDEEARCPFCSKDLDIRSSRSYM